jgi:hypothetical protein
MIASLGARYGAAAAMTISAGLRWVALSMFLTSMRHEATLNEETNKAIGELWQAAEVALVAGAGEAAGIDPRVDPAKAHEFAEACGAILHRMLHTANRLSNGDRT